MIVKKNANMAEIIDNGYWILINPEWIVVNDDESCEEIHRSDWSNIEWLKRYSKEAYDIANNW